MVADDRYFSKAQKREVADNNRILSFLPNRCGICGKKVEDPWDCDHVIAYNKGGETTVENGQMSHPPCNRSKKDKYQRRTGGPLIFRGIGQEFSDDPY